MATPRKLLAALKNILARSDEPYREVERRAGLPAGTIGKLLAGEMHLRLRHIALLGGVLRVSVLDLFCEAYGRRGGPARLSKLVTADSLSQEVAKALFTRKVDERAMTTRFMNLRVEE